MLNVRKNLLKNTVPSVVKLHGLSQDLLKQMEEEYWETAQQQSCITGRYGVPFPGICLSFRVNEKRSGRA